MPLGLRFLQTPKKVPKKSNGGGKGIVEVIHHGKTEGIELKSLSDPLLNISSSEHGSPTGVSTTGIIEKSKSVHLLPSPTPLFLIGEPSEPIEHTQSWEFRSELVLKNLESEHQIQGEYNEGGGRQCHQVQDGEVGNNPLEIPDMIGSYFDNNGNPVDDDDDEETEKELVVGTSVVIPEPKCFINAAALMDEDKEYVPSPPVSLLFCGEPILKCPTVKYIETTPQKQRESNLPCRIGSNIPVSVRRRVPISKSFPDIIQTTMSGQSGQDNFGFKHGDDCSRRELTNPQLENSNIVADSLEEIPNSKNLNIENDGMRESYDMTDSTFGRELNFMINRPSLFDRMDSVGMMTESVLGISGITNEKPPEAWVVDFNSLSLDTIDGEELSTERERRKSTSSTSSLAYFISMDEVGSEAEESGLRKDELTSSTDSKKIFSMFVDIGKSQVPPPAPIQPKARHSERSLLPIKNRQFTGSGDCSSSNNLRLKVLHSGIPKYSSPSFQQRDQTSGKLGCASMTSSMAMSSVSDPDMGQLQGICSNRSSLHVANHEHDGSFTSSILSSMEMSTLGTGEMDICQGGPCFKLGMDLLRMFQEGINTDVNISVRGRYVKAHKCILASRSQYFAAVLSGNWIQKAGNTIHLDEFSYTTVQFTMYHIYSGTNEIPDTIDLMELATLTDMLGLEGLREVISQTLRSRFCHNFHRPCTGCISGVLEFFSLAGMYGMDDLHRKMTKWICKHFVRIWPTKAFATLGDELVEKCLRFSVNHLSPENLLDVTLGCDQLLSTMPTVRWTEAIFSIVNQLSEACVQFTGENISQVLQSQRFLLFGKGQTWNISRIENTFLRAILLLKPDEACLTHVALSHLIDLGVASIDEMFVDFLKMLRREVEKYLLSNASKAVLSKNWESLSSDVRKRICSTGFLGSDKSGIKGKVQIKNVGNGSATFTRSTRPPSTSSSRSGSAQAQGPVKTRPSPQQVKATEVFRQSPIPNEILLVEKQRSPSPLSVAEYASQKSTSVKSVASVRPMPSQPQTPVGTCVNKTPNVYAAKSNTLPTNPTAITNTKSRTTVLKSNVVGNFSGSKPTTPTQQVLVPPQVSVSLSPQQDIVARRSPKVTPMAEKEHSFDISRANSASSSGSARRGSISSRPTTVIKSSNPSTPSNKPFNTFTTKVSSQRRVVVREPSPPPPAKNIFLTNSEKAKAVSKPKLSFRPSRSNSISIETPMSPLAKTLAQANAHIRQSSLGSMSTGNRGTTTHVSSQSSRYISNKPKTNSEKTIQPPMSPIPKAKFGRGNSITISNNTVPNVQTTVGHGIANRITNRSGNVHGKREETSHSGKTRRTMETSCCQMSKSSIEIDSSVGSEPKMRTLAEIGRSSTFSKDEPTILGKMDLSLEYGM